MAGWSDSPIVTLARDGQVIELGRSGVEPVLHLHGSTGLGLAPVEVSSSARLTGDGNVVRGVRYGAREVFIPIRADFPTYGEMTAWRRELARVIAPHLGMTEVRIQDPVSGSDRYIRGYYKDGLSGDFGDDFTGDGQTFGLTFECPDPWWMGPQRLETMQVAPGAKPFLSQTTPFFPVILAQSVIAGSFDVMVEGDGAVLPTWEITGPGTDLVIKSGTDVIEVSGSFPAGQTVVLDARSGVWPKDLATRVSLRSRLFSLRPGPQQISVAMVSATPDTYVRLVYRERYLEGI